MACPVFAFVPWLVSWFNYFNILQMFWTFALRHGSSAAKYRRSTRGIHLFKPSVHH
jgi:hypothetical protein